MRLADFLTFPLNTAGRLRAALADESRRERTVLLSLAAYVLLWTAYGTIAKGTQGLHPDMTELVAWSRDLSWGYLKHPPLAAAVVWVWFAVFPFGEFSYYLLAMLMPALALWFAWRLSADYLEPEKRIAGLALLMLVPFFNFHALKFNVNTVLLPLWAATTFWFLRSFMTGSHVFAALAGFGAALCMLGKYWSVFLLAGLIVAALIDKRRAAYFRSPAPWITVAVGAIAMAPHLYWLWQSDFAPFTYAMTIHGEKPLIGTIVAALGYLLGSLGYVALPVLLVLAAARPDRTTLTDMVWPADTERRLAAAAFWAPFLLPALGAVASGAEITSLWSMSAWTLLAVLLLSSPRMTWREIDTRRVVLTAAALPVVLLLASPLIAILTRPSGAPPVNAQARLLATEAERVWHEATPQRLAFIGGDGDIVLGAVAYAADQPRAVLPGLPRPSAARLKRGGVLLLCFSGNASCLRDAARVVGAAASRTIQTDITQTIWGQVMPARRYTMIVVPPRL
jgi:4-amino-4-deoxy-L-arabinose transferase-like glycosyltransferase